MAGKAVVIDLDHLLDDEFIEIGSDSDEPIEIELDGDEDGRKEQGFCSSTRSCGHLCGGVTAETTHSLPCASCLPHDISVCSVCLSAMADLPAIKLQDCPHSLHLSCAQSLVASRWSGPRLTFDLCTRCPDCRTTLRHPALASALAPLLDLRKEVEAMALRRIVLEGLWPPKGSSSSPAAASAPAASSSSSSAAPTATQLEAQRSFAMSKLSYYCCSKCKKPFFAGLARCEAAGGSEDEGEGAGAGAGAAAAAAVPRSSSSVAAAPYGNSNSSSSSSQAAAGGGVKGGGGSRKRRREDAAVAAATAAPTGPSAHPGTFSASAAAVGGGYGGYGASAAAIAAQVGFGGYGSSTVPSALSSSAAGRSGSGGAMSSSCRSSGSSAAPAAAAAPLPLLCHACRPPPKGARPCAVHNDPSLTIFKCKYCCNRATHACRGGINHYCDSDHKIAEANAAKYGTVLNWAPILKKDTWRHCDGKGGCPLGVPHPPHGHLEPFAVGCASCMSEAEVAKSKKC